MIENDYNIDMKVCYRARNEVAAKLDAIEYTNDFASCKKCDTPSWNRAIQLNIDIEYERPARYSYEVETGKAAFFSIGECLKITCKQCGFHSYMQTKDQSVK